MGVTLSTESTLAPVSFASSVVGFISFLFTLLTLLRVFWTNLRTLGSANSDCRDQLSNLKQALYEERTHLRTVRRRCRGQYDEGAFHSLYTAVRHMIKDFKHLEQPFLTQPPDEHAEKRRYDHDLSEPDDYYNVNYRHLSLFGRILWLYRRSSFVSMSEQLARLQTRRIARQSVDIAVQTRFVERTVEDIDDRVSAISYRLGNVVGVRRVDTGQ